MEVLGTCGRVRFYYIALCAVMEWPRASPAPRFPCVVPRQTGQARLQSANLKGGFLLNIWGKGYNTTVDREWLTEKRHVAGKSIGVSVEGRG